jgi:hypothetical protein
MTNVAARSALGGSPLLTPRLCVSSDLIGALAHQSVIARNCLSSAMGGIRVS